MNIKIKILLLLLFSSCHSEEEKIDWKINELYEVKNVSKVEKNDTINIKYTDDSFVYLDEYCKWKTDFFIWLNESKLRENKVYKITNHNDGEKDNTYIYNQNDIQEVKDLYEDNEMFRQITYDIFNELTISETYCLAQANFTLNQHYQNYNGNLSDILYDYTVCDDSCFASNRLNLLGKMINEVKFVHFWHNDIEIEPCHLVNWMNSLPNGLIEIDERMYCKKDIISKSKESNLSNRSNPDSPGIAISRKISWGLSWLILVYASVTSFAIHNTSTSGQCCVSFIFRTSLSLGSSSMIIAVYFVVVDM